MIEIQTTSDWTVVAAVSAAVTAGLIAASGLAVFLQLRELQKSNKAQAYSTLVSWLQTNQVRQARRTLLTSVGLQFSEWTDDQIAASELVCSTYDRAGVLAKNGLLPKGLVAPEWRDSIIRCWERAQPMLIEYRRDRGDDFWDEFDWLYQEAKAVKPGTSARGSAPM